MEKIDTLFSQIKNLNNEEKEEFIDRFLRGEDLHDKPLCIIPFEFIKRVDPVNLLNILSQELPQTIAVVLSHIESNKAAVLLQNFPKEIQSEVIRRITILDYVQPEILREVERIVEKKLSYIEVNPYLTVGGIEQAVEILNLVDGETEKNIIENLEDEDPELAESLKKKSLIFEDIIMLDDRAVQKIMREVNAQELAKALFGVDKEVQEKVFRNMSKRAASMLMEDMDYMGPIRAKDVNDAQDRIISIIRHLEDTGEIIIAKKGENELIHNQPFFDTVEPSFEYVITNLLDEEVKELMTECITNKDYLNLFILTALIITSKEVKNKLLNTLNIIINIKLRFKLLKNKFTINSIEIINDAQKELMEFIKRKREEDSKEEEDKIDE